MRNTVSVGDGIYKSTDGGETWARKGLEATERIARIAIDPDDPDTVFVCATGPLWSVGEERGVYRTRDGGETWDRVLYVDEGTGCADIAMDPQEPEILYAGMWEFRRRADFFTSGGPGSGLY
ncbi:MAG: WD40/YVTN/BNR-like repeat-containing protein, partial [Acidobacteriota bacterium]